MEAIRQPDRIETFFKTLPNLSLLSEPDKWREYARLSRELWDLCESNAEYELLHRRLVQRLGV
jgi:hypothetical protein